MIAQPQMQYVHAVPIPQPQPQIVYQVPVQPAAMPQPVIPNVPTTGRQPVIPTVRQAQYQTQPTVPIPEPVIPGRPRRGQQPPIVTQPVVPMPEPEPAPVPMPGHSEFGEPSIPFPEPQVIPPTVPFPEPQVIPPTGARLAPGQYSAFDRPITPPHNPLPTPPKNLFELSPYIHLLQDLKRPIDESSLRRSHTVHLSQSTPVYTAMPQYAAPPQHGMQPDRKHKKGGLFRTLSARLGRRRHYTDSDDSDDPSRPAGAYGAAPMMQPIPEGSAFMYASVLPNVNPSPAPGGMGATPGVSPMPMPAPSPGPPSRPVTPRPPPIRIEHNSPYGNLLPSSQHRVIWNRKRYPTATHLFEAFKFLDHKPELAETVRTCSNNPNQASTIAASLGEHVRRDWDNVVVQLVRITIMILRANMTLISTGFFRWKRCYTTNLFSTQIFAPYF